MKYFSKITTTKLYYPAVISDSAILLYNRQNILDLQSTQTCLPGLSTKANLGTHSSQHLATTRYFYSKLDRSLHAFFEYLFNLSAVVGILPNTTTIIPNEDTSLF